jgi:hypothetical protein
VMTLEQRNRPTGGVVGKRPVAAGEDRFP